MLQFVMFAVFGLTSLRSKITSAYVALVIGTVLIAIIAFLDLLFLERQVTEGELVADFKDAVLEMRREEKNLFLYGDQRALVKTDDYAKAAVDMVRKHQTQFAEILQNSEPLMLVDSLGAYREQLESWSSAVPEARQKLEAEIRILGHDIYLSAESLSTQERKLLESAVQESQWFLFVFLLVVGLAIYVVGRQLKRAVLAPLKMLEIRLKQIAEGRFNHMQSPSKDREFSAFTNAFNRMLKELEIRQRRMLQSEKLASLGILASGVAHELNNPLSNISSSCQLLLEELTEASPEQLLIWLKQIDSETERGRNIVKTLLDFGGQRVFQKNQVNLFNLVNETQTILGKTLSNYSANLTINIPSGLVVNVDKQRIQQLFINIIQNALHAGGEGVNVRISAIVREKGMSMIPDGAEVAGDLKCISDYDGRFVEILVTDDGPGIPAQSLSKIFDPFYTTNEPGHGVGLGLFIVQEIVREHDGCLAIASRPHNGTQIIVLLPNKS